ncbi:MAG: N-acetyl-D-Glu racemase DgcA [Candidatus Competibacterales bacterium]|nr:N-acetyl-D-Glu racemase DgcA [Candidatus Competibacterales bacterium]
MLKLTTKQIIWPFDGTFVIARGAQTELPTVRVHLEDGHYTGRGEGVPVRYLGDSVEAATEQLQSISDSVADGIGRDDLRRLLPPGAARNALDAALWDIEAKRANRRVWEIAGTAVPDGIESCYTVSLRTPEEMAAQAARHPDFRLLKIKLGAGEGDDDRIRAVRAARPDARLIIDANQGWDFARLRRMAPLLEELGVEMIEQPLPASEDAALRAYDGAVPLCADETLQGIESLEGLRDRYAFVNIKLDKCGGLTEGLEIARAARDQGLGVMVGSMVGSSLAMAPHAVLATMAEYADLDGPLLLADDVQPGIFYEGSVVRAWPPEVWG